MRASLDGFQSHTRSVTIASDQQVAFSLVPANSANVTGEWRLAIEVSPSCHTLLEIARRRIYLATVAQDHSIGFLNRVVALMADGGPTCDAYENRARVDAQPVLDWIDSLTASVEPR
jgi:hypothetical protein